MWYTYYARVHMFKIKLKEHINTTKSSTRRWLKLFLFLLLINSIFGLIQNHFFFSSHRYTDLSRFKLFYLSIWEWRFFSWDFVTSVRCRSSVGRFALYEFNLIYLLRRWIPCIDRYETDLVAGIGAENNKCAAHQTTVEKRLLILMRIHKKKLVK